MIRRGLLMMAPALWACGNAQGPRVTSRGLVREFAAVTDSIAFLRAASCCDADVLVLRPRGRWSLLRLGRIEQDFEAPADSMAYRAVAERLIGLGAAAGWPPTFGIGMDDTPTATITIRAPGQCHQTTATPSAEYAFPKGSLPAEWLGAIRLLDSLIAHAPWQADSTRPLARTADRGRWLCRWQEVGG